MVLMVTVAAFRANSNAVQERFITVCRIDLPFVVVVLDDVHPPGPSFATFPPSFHRPTAEDDHVLQSQKGAGLKPSHLVRLIF